MRRHAFRIFGFLAMLATAVPAMRVFADSTDIWSTATTAVGTAATNTTSILIAIVAIPLAIFGYKVVKRCLH